MIFSKIVGFVFLSSFFLVSRSKAGPVQKKDSLELRHHFAPCESVLDLAFDSNQQKIYVETDDEKIIVFDPKLRKLTQVHVDYFNFSTRLTPTSSATSADFLPTPSSESVIEYEIVVESSLVTRSRTLVSTQELIQETPSVPTITEEIPMVILTPSLDPAIKSKTPVFNPTPSVFVPILTSAFPEILESTDALDELIHSFGSLHSPHTRPVTSLFTVEDILSNITPPPSSTNENFSNGGIAVTSVLSEQSTSQFSQTTFDPSILTSNTLNEIHIPTETIEIPEVVVPTPEPEVITPEPEVITPEPEVIIPEPEVVIPAPEVITPEIPEVLAPAPAPEVVVSTPETTTDPLIPELEIIEENPGQGSGETTGESPSELLEGESLTPDNLIDFENEAEGEPSGPPEPRVAYSNKHVKASPELSNSVPLFKKNKLLEGSILVSGPTENNRSNISNFNYKFQSHEEFNKTAPGFVPAPTENTRPNILSFNYKFQSDEGFNRTASRLVSAKQIYSKTQNFRNYTVLPSSGNFESLLINQSTDSQGNVYYFDYDNQDGLYKLYYNTWEAVSDTYKQVHYFSLEKNQVPISFDIYKGTDKAIENMVFVLLSSGYISLLRPPAYDATTDVPTVFGFTINGVKPNRIVADSLNDIFHVHATRIDGKELIISIRNHKPTGKLYIVYMIDIPYVNQIIDFKPYPAKNSLYVTTEIKDGINKPFYVLSEYVRERAIASVRLPCKPNKLIVNTDLEETNSEGGCVYITTSGCGNQSGDHLLEYCPVSH